ncbi:MAG: FMN-binding protein [Chloroflexi bacterium]|nr:FMN-binding protein [Chloroflexota bacterium]
MAKSAARSIQDQRNRQKRRQGIATLSAFAILVIAWLIGQLSATAAVPLDVYVGDVLPGADRIELGEGGLFTGYAGDEIVGYAMAGTASGYGGPMVMLVGTDPDGAITAVTMINHGETPNFLAQLDRAGYYDQFTGASYSDTLLLGEDIDGVSGATLSSEAVAQAIRLAVRGIAANAIPGAEIPPDVRPIHFGAPEITLIALFVVSFFLHRLKHRPSLKRIGRWAVLLTGLIVIGFIFNKPWTLSNVVTLISGWWPDWQTNLYWFILVGGIITVTLIQGKNPYCSWFCPFGAAQEVLGTISGAKAYQPRQIYNKLRWVQRALSFTAIALGLAMRQPGAVSYEPFGTLFDLQGSWPQWVLLILILFGSLVIYRPFCNYLCPLDPVVDYIGEVRRWMRNAWNRRSQAVSTSSTAS